MAFNMSVFHHRINVLFVCMRKTLPFIKSWSQFHKKKKMSYEFRKSNGKKVIII